MANKKKSKLGVWLFALEILSFLASAGPLIVTMILKRSEYFTEPSDSVKLGLGALLVFVFIVFKTLGRIKMPRGIVGFGLLFLLSYLLESILKDMLLLSGMAFLGETLDLIFFRGQIKKVKEKIALNKTAATTADVTVSGVEELMKKYVGNGRT